METIHFVQVETHFFIIHIYETNTLSGPSGPQVDCSHFATTYFLGPG